ncbi:Smr/MutS family protein [Sphingomonas quercus]|uniref:Smr/MutS family protein n=1 Tax=Sphingomonas quercus TaxID=2842451 RepID=A0ABS6BLC8_9SPHN|nr:Smr/MutS family protein [Sphingomonas quercus]MBU3079098.1 Smr/MutS family protein [Sphingomonas quercus]
MVRRRLDPEEQALWAKVAGTVKPLPGRVVPPVPRHAVAPDLPAVLAHEPQPARERKAPPRPAKPPANTLDATWDRRLGRGLAAPDMTLDLHGYTLAAAHAALDAGLARAVAQQARLVLLVTGRPPRGEWHPDVPRRGAIRAAIGDWLGSSRFADRIAAVRGAHPRHGGAGALYIVMRRPR